MPKVQRALAPYMQIAVELRRQIQQGELQPGDLIPSDRQLASDWGVSRVTASKAITTLRAERLVASEHGVGTRVLSQGSADVHSSGRDRADSVRRTGKIYRPGEYARITEAALVTAPDDVLRELRLEAGDQAIRRVRVTYGPDDVVRSTSTSWYDGALAESAPRLLQTERIEEGSWAYLEAQAGVSAAHGQERVSSRLATDEEAELLGLTAPAAVKVARTILRSEDGVAVEYGVSVSGPDRESIFDYEIS